MFVPGSDVMTADFFRLESSFGSFPALSPRTKSVLWLSPLARSTDVVRVAHFLCPLAGTPKTTIVTVNVRELHHLVPFFRAFRTL